MFRWSAPFVKKFQKASMSQWMSLGFPSRMVERVSFYIESLGTLNYKREVLILEILTKGRISPRQAVREAALLLVNKFLNIARIRIPLYRTIPYIIVKKKKFSKKRSQFKGRKLKSSTPILTSEQNLYNVCNMEFSHFREPLGLDLGNLDVNKERYSELLSLGFRTLGQLLERLTFESSTFSPFSRKQLQIALFRLGLFPFY
jgi:DNA-directed RNA polymerase alpha subunit